MFRYSPRLDMEIASRSGEVNSTCRLSDYSKWDKSNLREMITSGPVQDIIIQINDET
jgi:hypothetical protein